MQHNPWELINQTKTVSIASVDKSNSPHISYAPFVENAKKFYICISMMAKHTQNLLNSDFVSTLMIEDETTALNLFARKRVTFDMRVDTIERASDKFVSIMGLFRDKFGDNADIYESMTDFQLFELTPISGRAVFGFGQAYDFKDGDFGDISVGMGHQSK